LGFKIDYEEENENDNYLPKVRSIAHLHENWLLNNSKFFIWQQFIQFLYHHLRDVNEIDQFYFNLLDELSSKIYTQNTKRAVIESYIKLLDYEGRFIYPFVCQVCDKQIQNSISFTKGLLPHHPSCVYHNKVFDMEKLENLFILKNAFFLSNDMVDDIFDIIF
jgi:hypothetical protein